MRSAHVVIVFLIGVCTTQGSPTEITALSLRQEQLNIVENTRLLIEQLVANLQKASKEALHAVETFRHGMIEQAKLLQEKVVSDIEKLRERIQQALQNFYDRLTNSGQAVRECATSHRVEAENIFNDTMKQSIACADDHIKGIGEQLDSLTTLANNASDLASTAMDEMRECIKQNESSANIISVGTCLSSVAMKIEMRGAVFVTQSGVQVRIGRLNLALATLPATLEICAGSQLVQAGMSTAKIIMDIGTCSASSIFSSLFGTTLY